MDTFSSSLSQYSFDLRGYKVTREFVELESQYKYKTKEAKLKAAKKEVIEIAINLARTEVENITEESVRAISHWKKKIEQLKEFE